MHGLEGREATERPWARRMPGIYAMHSNKDESSKTGVCLPGCGPTCIEERCRESKRVNHASRKMANIT